MTHRFPNKSNYNASTRIKENKNPLGMDIPKKKKERVLQSEDHVVKMDPVSQHKIKAKISKIEKAEPKPSDPMDDPTTPHAAPQAKVVKKVVREVVKKQKQKEFKLPNVAKIIKKVKEEGIMKKAINFGIVGLGQGGCRLAYEFEKLDYPTIAINTSSQDLEKIDCKNKLAIGEGGAGKDLKIGSEAVNRNLNKIMDAYKREFKTVDHILICAGSSGGTGGGGLTNIISSLRNFKKPVGVLTTFPLATEDTRAKKNTLSVLNELIKLNSERKIRPLILIDNDKIEQKHPGLSTLEFWNVANDEVVKTFDLFNKLAATSTAYTSLDPADYAKIMNSGGCMIFGNIAIKDEPEDVNQMFSNAIKDNINSGLLAEGFNLVEATHCGCIIASNPEKLAKVPRRAEENAMATLMEIIGSGSVYRGVYGLEALTYSEVFFMLSGLGLPIDRIRNLIQGVKQETEHLVEKAPTRTVTDIMNDLGEGQGIDLDNVGVDIEEE